MLASFESIHPSNVNILIRQVNRNTYQICSSAYWIEFWESYLMFEVLCKTRFACLLNTNDPAHRLSWKCNLAMDFSLVAIHSSRGSFTHLCYARVPLDCFVGSRNQRYYDYAASRVVNYKSPHDPKNSAEYSE